MTDKELETRVANLEKQILNLANRQTIRDNTNESEISNTNSKVSANETNISSSTWVQNVVYHAGEFTTYSGVLWRCLVNTTTAPKESTEWTQVSLTDVVIELANRINALENK